MVKSRALAKLFPESQTLEEKALRFLQVCYANNWSYNATGKQLGLHHSTVKSLLEEIKQTPVYHRFLQILEDEVKDFLSPEFRRTVFQYYQELLREAQSQYTSMKKSGNHKEAEKWYRNILSVCRDMLRASLVGVSQEQNTDNNYDKFVDIYEEALSEYGRVGENH